MLCNKCKKNYATTHIKTVINGVVNEQYLCSECAAKEKNVNLNLNNLISSLIYGDINTLEEKRCNICGSSFNDIINSGKAGCSNCYSVFKNEFTPYIKNIHGHSKHIKNNEKINTLENNDNKNKELEELENNLKLAIKEERYEDAAILRDKIIELKGEN